MIANAKYTIFTNGNNHDKQEVNSKLTFFYIEFQLTQRSPEWEFESEIN